MSGFSEGKSAENVPKPLADRSSWTLQELLAPHNLLFFDKDWEPIQSKWELADHLSVITSIPTKVLRHQTHLKDICAAARMSWASKRQTSRSEDIAYCMLGIFDINMPLLYGEGTKAFFRLQEAILKRLETRLCWLGIRLGVRIHPRGPMFLTLTENIRTFRHWQHRRRTFVNVGILNDVTILTIVSRAS